MGSSAQSGEFESFWLVRGRLVMAWRFCATMRLGPVRSMSSKHTKNLRFGRNGKGRSASKAGFTLVEVMVSTLLMMIIFGGGFGALVHGNRLIEASRDETRASQILQSEVEDLRTYDWTALTALDAEASYSP